MFFVFFYGFFIDAVSFIYSSEIYPTNIRARGMSLATFTYFAACIPTSPWCYSRGEYRLALFRGIRMLDVG